MIKTKISLEEAKKQATMGELINVQDNIYELNGPAYPFGGTIE